MTGVITHFLHSLTALCQSGSLSSVFINLRYYENIFFSTSEIPSAQLKLKHKKITLMLQCVFALDILLCSLLVWLLKCAKLAKLELEPAFMLGGAAKMSPPKSLRRSNLLSWNCCWWVCPRLTTGDW